MELLLDTHVWFWMSVAPEQLGRRASLELQRPTNNLWISPLSVLELARMQVRGALRINDPFEKWVERSIDETPLREAQLTRSVVYETRALGLGQGDPIDMVIVATARVNNLTLVTADQKMLEARKCRMLPAR